MANIFQLFGQIFIDNAEADKSIDTTTKKAEDSGSKVGAAFSSIAKGAAAVGTAVVGAASALGTAAYKMANDTAAQADVIDKMSERTAINREELQRWIHACDQSGVSSEKLETAVKKMSDVLDDAANGSSTANEAIERLGFSLEDFDGLSTEEKFSKIADALADMEEGTERNAIGADVFGKAYTEMLPLLNAGSQGIAELKQEADDLGIVMSEEDVKAGVKLGDTIANIEAAFNGFKNTLGSAVVPIVQSFADMIIDALPKVQSLVEELTPIVVEIFEEIMPPLFDFIDTIFPMLISFVEQLLPVLQNIITAILPVVVNLLNTLAPLFATIVEQILPVIVDLITQLMPFISQIISTILPAFVSLITTLLPYVMQIVEAILPVFINLIETLLPPILQIVDAVLPVILEIIEAVMPLVVEIINAVLPVLIELINEILPPILQIVDMILPLILNLIESLLPLITTIVEAVLPIIVELLKILSPVLKPILDLLVMILAPITELLNLILPPIINLLKNIIEKIMPPLRERFSEVASTVSGVFKGAFESIGKIFGNVKDIFSNIIDFVKNVFTGNWKEAWGNVKKIFADIWDTLKTIVKAPINFIIDGINLLIRGLNKVSFDVPDWVPVIGGKTFGFNIKELSKLRVGMDYVPYDDYPALLHRGEQVLTASEAKEKRQEEQEEKNGSEEKGTVNIDVSVNIERFENNTDQDLDSLADELMTLLQDKIKQKGAVFA